MLARVGVAVDVGEDDALGRDAQLAEPLDEAPPIVPCSVCTHTGAPTRACAREAAANTFASNGVSA